MPGIDLGLQPVALGQQRGVLRGQVVHDLVEALPEGGGLDAGAGQHLVFDEAEQLGGDLQAVDGGAFGHGVVQVEGVGKKSSTARRLLPMRVGSVSSCSSGNPARLTHNVV